MDKEELEKFDKYQLDILLNDLQDIDKFTGFKNGAFKYELGKYQANLLINCIKKQQEIIDKAIDKIEYYSKYCGYDGTITIHDKELKELLDILNEVSE